MIHCSPLRDRHVEELNKIRQYFNDAQKNPNLVRTYGNMDNQWVQKQLSALFLDANHIPMNPDFVPTKKGKLDMSVYNQMKRAIDKWEKSLSGSVNSFEAMVRTPSALYRKNPITIRFNNKVSSILNAERRNKAVYIDNIRGIAKQLKEIMSSVNEGKGRYSKVSKKLDKVYNKIANHVSNKDIDKASVAIREMNNILKSDDSNRVIETYVRMMEEMNYDDLLKFQKNPRHPDLDPQVMSRLVNVVKESKNLLNTMGEVNIKGLRKMNDVIDKYFDKADSSLTRGLRKNVDKAIQRVQEGMDKGRYFPHYSVESMLNIESIVDNINPFKITKDADYRQRVLEDINSAVRKLPSNLEAASREKSQLFQKDPIRVLESYSQNSAMFNKKQFLMDAYLEALHDLKPRQTNFDGLEQMSEYLAHKYTATMQGYIDANESVKALSSAVAKLQTTSKMGLSLTGAVRNASQHFWYVTYTGFNRYRKGKKLLNTNDTYFYGIDKDGKYIEKDIQGIINDVSREAGYFFDSQSMETISKGGLTNIDGVRNKDIRHSVDENGNPIIEYRQDGVWRKIDKAMGKITGRSLMFHQWTENVVRADVYKNSFANHFDMLFKNENYKNNLAQEYIKAAREKGRTLSDADAMRAVHKRIEKDSHNMALNWVRMTQFEYTTPDRPNLFGGGTTNASALGNSVFQFFPYAAHMFEMNSRVYREGLQAIKHGDINSWKFGAMARMFGFQTFGVGLASILFNNEFRYLIENDTYSRLRDLYRLFTADDLTEADFGNGLVQQLTGPVVADMLFWMEAAGISNFGDNELSQLLLGYYDIANMAESDRERSMINRISVSLAKVHRSKESFIQGDLTGILRSNLLLYPSQQTQKGHQFLMDLLGFEDPRQQRRRQEERLHSTLLNLPEDQKDQILRTIREIKETREVDRTIPTGLENLTIR